MRVLGLDPSLNAYGWAIHDFRSSGALRRVDSGHEGTLSSTVPVARFMHFRSLVDKLLKEYQPDAVGLESPAYDAGPFQTTHFGLMMFSMEPIFARRKDLVLFDPATLKALVRGSMKSKLGTITKLEMQRFVQLDLMDTNILNDNEADAYCVSYFASRFLRTLEGTLDPNDLNPSELNTFLLRTKVIKTLKGNRKKFVSHAFKENSRYFAFSKIPAGEITLPEKSQIPEQLLEFIEDKTTVCN